MKRSATNKSKERFDKWGWVTWGTVDPFRKIQPSYLEIPRNNGERDEAPTIKLNRRKAYPVVIRYIMESPSYLYSFVGLVIARDYAKSYDLTQFQASILIIFSFHEVFYLQDIGSWAINRTAAVRTVKDLRRWGFVTCVSVPSQHAMGKTRKAYILSPLGVNFVNGYKDFFDSKMAKIKNTPGATNISLKRKRWFDEEEKREQEIQEKIWNERILERRRIVKKPTSITSSEE